MLLRRVVGLTAWLLLLQLMLVSSDVICLQHGGHGSHDTASHSAMPSGHHEHGAQSTQSNGSNDSVPGLPNCCQAMTTCATTVAIRPANATLLIASARDGAMVTAGTLPPTRVEPPEPPPPRV